MVQTLPESLLPLEAQVLTLIETTVANIQPTLVETGINQCISAKPVPENEEQHLSPPIFGILIYLFKISYTFRGCRAEIP